MFSVSCCEQTTVHLFSNDVEWAALRWCDARYPGSKCLLQRLTERFVYSGVHEDVETREMTSKCLTREETRKYRIRHQSLQTFPLWTVADDDEANSWVVGKNRQVFHSLLVRQPPYVSHDGSAIDSP